LINTAKIKSFFEKNYRILLFLFVFVCICYIYNINHPYINKILKKGTILEYSISKNGDIFKKELDNLNIKYLKTGELELDNIEYDTDNEAVEKIFFVKIPVILNEKTAQIVNKISDTVFQNDKEAKLIGVADSGAAYNEHYSAFIKFLGLIFTSGVIYFILLYLFFDKEISLKKIFESFKTFLLNRKASFLNLVNKTKEKGPKYLVKKILFDEAKDENGEEKETDFTKEIISTVIFVLFCVIVIRYFIGELRWIPSGSMRPTILEKDRVFVEKLKYPKKEIKRGDILVFYPPEVQLSNSPFAIISRLSGIFCRDIAFIKRTVGMPGEKFEIKQNERGEYHVFINDSALDEPYINSLSSWTPCAENMHCGPFTIPKNHYFMMGDNRNNSQDSRFWGFLDENRVIGRANFMFFPIARINVLKDRYVKLHKKMTENSVQEAVFIVDRY